jgi:glutaminyl-tRNA synthetase
VSQEPTISASNSSALASTHFIRNIIEADLAADRHALRRWSGHPGPAAQQLAGPLDPARIRTRFPPEPNGYLHFGHAKSICLNFGLAQDYGGRCHLRFDDTNPEKEEQEYVDSIVDSVRWLGFSWDGSGEAGESECNLYFASNYFDWMVQFAEYLIASGHAYVDSQSAEAMRATRGTLTDTGTDSPFRQRGVEENMDLFKRMQQGEFPDGAHVLRAKIDMASANINLRDPAIYRIRHASHHNTGDRWCVYPMYTYAHPIEDALENITHSICTLEFADQRPFYDWLLERLAEGGLLQRPLPQQIEFSRLNLTYIVLSKRKLIQLVEEKHVAGWDDPRLPTLVGARRRGYPAEGFRLFAERVGVSRSDSLIEYTQLEDTMREVLNDSAERRVAVLDPLRLIIDNYPAGQSEECLRSQPSAQARDRQARDALWPGAVDRARRLHGAAEQGLPPPLSRQHGAFALRLCCPLYRLRARREWCRQRRALRVPADSKSGTPGADGYKVKGNLHWVSVADACLAEVRLYDRLFAVPSPGARREGDPEGVERDFRATSTRTAFASSRPGWSLR